MSSPAIEPVIRTDRLVLRRVRPDKDFAAIHAILSNPEAMAYWETPPHASEEETRNWLAAMAQTTDEEGDDFILEYQGRAIGKAGFYRFPTLGYIIAPEFWGQGLVLEALVPIITRAFTVGGVARIATEVDPRNTASIRILEKLGFSETHRAEKTALIGDVWCDSIYFALTADGWAARTA